ncbi:response regulator transcription factor [soil metagenome]
MLRIAVADDHSIVRKGIIQILREEYPEIEICEASNSMEIIELMRDGKWSLLISDISMPGRSGIETLKQIKEIYPDLPVLMLSMHPEEQYAIRSLKSGASGYLTKESAPDELILAVKSILNGKKYIPISIAEKLADHIGVKNHEFPHSILSDRENDVFILIASGKTVTEIASQLSLSVNTISTYRARILEKMHMKTNAELTHYAFSNNLL